MPKLYLHPTKGVFTEEAMRAQSPAADAWAGSFIKESVPVEVDEKDLENFLTLFRYCGLIGPLKAFLYETSVFTGHVVRTAPSAMPWLQQHYTRKDGKEESAGFSPDHEGFSWMQHYRREKEIDTALAKRAFDFIASRGDWQRSWDDSTEEQTEYWIVIAGKFRHICQTHVGIGRQLSLDELGELLYLSYIGVSKDAPKWNEVSADCHCAWIATGEAFIHAQFDLPIDEGDLPKPA